MSNPGSSGPINWLVVTKLGAVYYGEFESIFKNTGGKSQSQTSFVRLVAAKRVLRSWKGNWLVEDYNSLILRKSGIAARVEMPRVKDNRLIELCSSFYDQRYDVSGEMLSKSVGMMK